MDDPAERPRLLLSRVRETLASQGLELWGAFFLFTTENQGSDSVVLDLKVTPACFRSKEDQAIVDKFSEIEAAFKITEETEGAAGEALRILNDPEGFLDDWK